MFSTNIMLRTPISLLKPALLALLMVCAPAQLYAQTAAGQEQGNGMVVKPPGAIENLASIQQSIESKRSAIRELREQLKQVEDRSERQEFEQKIERTKNEIAGLQQAFEHIALGGINISILGEQAEEQIDWRSEIEQVSRPLLSSLKELTAKPRQIDSLRREIDRQEARLKIIERALDSIRSFQQAALPAVTAEPVRQLLDDWEQRRDDTGRALEISRYKLASLKTESASWQSSAGEAMKDFIRGRGLTLLIATITGLAIWLVSKGLLRLYWKWLYQTTHDIGATRAPLFYYSYRLASAFFIALAVLMVLYIRGDVLLLTLALIALAGIALTLRHTLPRYIAELRLLLGVGPVREQERLVLDGIPFTVESLSVYSVLRNPALEGVMRLPLHVMNTLTSRPAGQEPWFPCEPGDFIILANGGFGRVLQQTIELVEVAVLDSRVQIRTKDFLGQNVRNLTREGFGIANSFGIDYRHQAICLDTVPGLFREAILARFEGAGLKGDIKDILVEFKAAGASSLDYQIYIVLNGRAANAYFRAQRLVQQACVDACNREGWVIPFTQITVHSGDVADMPSKPAARSAGGAARPGHE